MRVWTDERILSGDVLAPWALQAGVARLASVVGGLLSWENMPANTLSATKMERRAVNRIEHVEADDEVDDTELDSEVQGWRTVDSMLLELTTSECMVHVSAFGRWKDTGADTGGRPRQFAVFVDGAIVAIGPQIGFLPIDLVDFDGFYYFRVAGAVPVSSGAHTFELRYRNHYDSDNASARAACTTTLQNRRLVVREARR